MVTFKTIHAFALKAQIELEGIPMKLHQKLHKKT
jgi:hypothetical protein